MTSNDSPGRKLNDPKRVNSPTGWIVGGVFVVAVLGVLFFYQGRSGSTSSSGANPPNVVSGSSSPSADKK
jgi:hypothetical protein